MTDPQWPVTSDGYVKCEEVGRGGSATVWRGNCLPLNCEVAIKIINLEETKVLLDVIRKEIMTLGMSNHPNVVKFHTSFLVDETLWLIMDYMSAGSVLDIMKFKFQHGLAEELIATILRETLKGIKYFHDTERIHRDVKAGNILISDKGDVKLADLGVSAWLMAEGERKDLTKTFAGTPCWMAPEVMEQTTGHGLAADIWSFGITALELAYGQVPFAHLKPMKVLITVLKEPPPTLDSEAMKARGWSKTFKDMIDTCLVKDPSKRPTSTKLLEHKFFKSAKNPNYIVTKLLEHLPPLGVRFAAELAKTKESLLHHEDDTSSRNNVPDDDLADQLNVEPWDFGSDDDGDSKKKKKKKDTSDAGNDNNNDDGDDTGKSSRKTKKKDTSGADSGAEDDDADKPRKSKKKDNGDSGGDDDDDVSKPRKSKKKEASSNGADSGVEDDDDDETTGKSTSRRIKKKDTADSGDDADDKPKKVPTKRKQSKAGSGSIDIVSDKTKGTATGDDADGNWEKRGRFSVQKTGEDGLMKTSSKATVKKTKKSDRECTDCEALRERIAALEKENKKLRSRLKEIDSTTASPEK
mmetsp:Transcript_19568/g.33636  ORF Transcript_19568/g.33636 Transcript_19568/m.33636 type:complete len:580 (-) Transcript_19568:30-1769(-)